MGGSSRSRVYAAVVSARKPVRLEEIAAAVGLTKSPTHRHLDNLVHAGRIQRIRHGGTVHYLPRSHVQIEWTHVHPTPGENPDLWFHRDWSSATVDWRFPLVSRVPDAKGRQTILTFLESAWDLGLFQPWLRHQDTPRPRAHEGFTLAAFGTCARGEAHADSDVDVLCIQPGSSSADDAGPDLLSLADEVNLGAPRYLDLMVVRRDGQLPERIRHAIMLDGITVFTTFPGGEFVEEWGRHDEVVGDLPRFRTGGDA